MHGLKVIQTPKKSSSWIAKIKSMRRTARAGNNTFTTLQWSSVTPSSAKIRTKYISAHSPLLRKSIFKGKRKDYDRVLYEQQWWDSPMLARVPSSIGAWVPNKFIMPLIENYHDTVIFLFPLLTEILLLQLQIMYLPVDWFRNVCVHQLPSLEWHEHSDGYG